MNSKTMLNHSPYYTARERIAGVNYNRKCKKNVFSDNELKAVLKPHYKRLRVPSISGLEERIKGVEARQRVGKPGEQKNPEDELLPAIDSIIQARVTSRKNLVTA